jgi:hypothetical protein
MKDSFWKTFRGYFIGEFSDREAGEQGEGEAAEERILSSAVPYSVRNEPMLADPRLPNRRPLPLLRIPFLPARFDTSEEVEDDRGHKYQQRMLTYGLLSLFLFGVIFVFMEDPGGYVRQLTGKRTTLSWQGLGVYSSIVALVFFLVVLLLRYLALLNTAYLNTAKYTISEKSDIGFPPVSIIVPAYNEGKLLHSTVRSLLKIKYPQYEIVIVDDGSRDDTRAVAETLVGDYGNVHVKLVEKTNGGKATALNAGIQVKQLNTIRQY